MSAPDLEERIRTHLAALDASPSDGAALDALAAIYREGGRFEDLIRLCEAQARRAANPEQAASLLTRAGEVAREGLKNPSRAEDLFRQFKTCQADMAKAESRRKGTQRESALSEAEKQLKAFESKFCMSRDEINQKFVELRDHMRNGQKARTEMVEANLRLVISIVK